ncbi:hypothetical protein [Streptomyces griseus]|uniref:hypothetical protein n=1 Tax=Streptomyces griseus TaxID=1911 RepID=UPI000B1A7E1E
MGPGAGAAARRAPLSGALALRISYAGDLRDDARTRGRDAYWIGHAWVGGRKRDADLRALAARLRGTGIKDLYVHAGPLEHDGTLPASRHPRARWLVDGVRRELPGVRVQAWLGGVLANGGPTGLRLSGAAPRAAVTASARQVLDAGFAGVHFDLEPLRSGDADYLALLDDLGRPTRTRTALLSVAAHPIDPLPGSHSALRLVSDQGKWWSREYFGEVARRVDRIAVMSYDTWMPLESSYGGYVARRTGRPAARAGPAPADPGGPLGRPGGFARSVAVSAAGGSGRCRSVG